VNIAQLRDIVTTLLTASPDLIGSYTLPNEQAIPAVYVVGQKGVPSEWKVSGLEVTMRQYPELLPKAGVGIVDILKQWEVVLVQYNPDSTQIADAMERMSRRFPDATFRYLPGDDVAYERCRIIIPDREVKTILR
jgi:hypothetical protein